MHIRPLDSLTVTEAHAMAVAAAERAEPADTNPFAAGTAAHTAYALAWRTTTDALATA